jgi:hypothetical protein
MDAQTTAGAEYGQPELLSEIRSSWALIERQAPEASAYFY